MALAPTRPEPYIHLAILYEAVERPDLAVEAMEQLRRTNPDATHLRCRLAEAYLGTEDLKQARAAGEEATRREPDCPRAWSVYGLASARFRYWDAATSSLRKAMQLAPADNEIADALVNVYLHQGAYAEAIRLGEPLWPKMGGSAEFAYKLGMAYSRLPQQGDNPEKAMTFLRRAAALNPAWFEPQAELGRLYKSRGQTREAIAAFERAWKLNPTVSGVAFNLAGLYRDVGDPRAAALQKRFDEMQRGEARFKQLRQAYNAGEAGSAASARNTLALADSEARAGLSAVALQRLRRALAEDPADLEALRMYLRIDRAARHGKPDYLRPGPGVGPPPAL
jgi:tetratricopeptide (TPR) repeat protein